jgi:hypothetical protein
MEVRLKPHPYILNYGEYFFLTLTESSESNSKARMEASTDKDASVQDGVSKL